MVNRHCGGKLIVWNAALPYGRQIRNATLCATLKMIAGADLEQEKTLLDCLYRAGTGSDSHPIYSPGTRGGAGAITS